MMVEEVEKFKSKFSSIIAPGLFLPLFYSLSSGPRYSPKTTETFLSSYDYIIVGAGAAGSALAGRLSDVPCIKILLLEAGKTPPILTEVPVLQFKGTEDLDWNYYTTPQKRTGRIYTNRKLLYGIGKAIGGSSILNGMAYVRGHRHIYDLWHEHGATNWSYHHVLPYFKKMEMNKNPELVDIELHGFDGPITVETPRFTSPGKRRIASALKELGYYLVDSNGYQQSGLYDCQRTIRNGQRCSTAKAYLVPNDNKNNLHIVEDAFVTKITFDGNTATGVQFISRGKVFKISVSKEVIISAGAINTPKLLILSGIGPRDHLQKLKINVIADLPVGLNFQEHIGAVHHYYSDSVTPPKCVSYDNDTLQYINSRTGFLSFAKTEIYMAFSTQEVNEMDGVPNYLFYLSFSKGPDFVEKAINQKVRKKVFGPYINKTVFTCATSFMRPKSRGFVRLRSSDPFEPPIIDPNIFDDPTDPSNLVESLKICDEIANTRAFKSIKMKPIETTYPGCEIYNRSSDAFLRCEIENYTTLGFHPVGTVKMGNFKDPTVVVDPQLKVKGINRLRVVDASIMPIIPAANTYVPSIMVGEKAADIIKSEIQCKDFKYNNDFSTVDDICKSNFP